MSNTKMRKEVMEAGGYYSSAMRQWCYVGRGGATYYASLKEAYEDVDRIRAAVRAHLGDLRAVPLPSGSGW